VGREAFAQAVTAKGEAHPLISLRREEVHSIPQGSTVVLATGPLTSASLAEDIAQLAGVSRGTFYFHFPTKEAVLMEYLGMKVIAVSDPYIKEPTPAYIPEDMLQEHMQW